MKTKQESAVEWLFKWHENNREATYEEFSEAFKQALLMYQEQQLRHELNKSE
jgi:hypothetical protein